MGEAMEKLTYEEAYELVKEEIQKALTRSPRIINEYLTHLSASQGKMIRAVSVLICAGDGEGKIAPGAVHAAAAIEIVHLASLVHDDIIDNADLRRGQETLQKKYGKRTAVICGDYLLSLALKMLAAVPDRKEYTDIDLPDYISRLCLGELLQHINNKNLNLTVFEYIRIISGKTAALFEASFFAGAVLGGSAAEDIKKYKKIGNYTGLIFQLRDDCLDFDKTIEEAKKPVQSDYEQGVVTLPLIRALEKRPDFRKKAEAGEIVRADINRAVQEAGGLDYTKEMIERYYKKAKRYIDKLDVTEEKREKVAAIVKKAAGIKA
ncbi:heptaprenyl diphosphate synthase [Kineothrix alysoides]|uniref:Heptaprenyl diphosphate synthase n=1 Tax=Kineothrix alysoides TaxID=1469948 RepID=A0A4R1QQ45_9FIRM|nr:polyprenyl synthetase family protein [Kineothrix alysoides]TCL55041.1 heptaprenyl diphosphate synthase [Kineothrix alysoides]